MREKCDTRSTVATHDPTVRIMYITRSHIVCTPLQRDAQDAGGLKLADQSHTTTRMEQDDDGREGLQKEEKAVMRSVEEDPEFRRAEEEHKRKLVEIENDDGPRGRKQKEK